MSNVVLELVEPSVELKESYIALVQEFMDAGEDYVPFVLKFQTEDFPKLIEELAGYSKGLGIEEGWVSHSTYWLVRNGKDVVAVSNMRHELTDKLRVEGGNIGYGVRPSERRKGYATAILRETAKKAKAMGMDKVLVTCDKENTGSVRAILNNGGILDSEEYVEELNKIVQRYWVHLS